MSYYLLPYGNDRRLPRSMQSIHWIHWSRSVLGSGLGDYRGGMRCGVGQYLVKKTNEILDARSTVVSRKTAKHPANHFATRASIEGKCEIGTSFYCENIKATSWSTSKMRRNFWTITIDFSMILWGHSRRNFKNLPRLILISPTMRAMRHAFTGRQGIQINRMEKYFCSFQNVQNDFNDRQNLYDLLNYAYNYSYILRCYLDYCRMKDKNGCRMHCHSFAKNHVSDNESYETIEANQEECVQRLVRKIFYLPQ